MKMSPCRREISMKMSPCRRGAHENEPVQVKLDSFISVDSSLTLYLLYGLNNLKLTFS